MAWFHYLIAMSLGLVVGVSELVTRYRDAPRQALFTPAAFVYVALNAGAAGAALLLVDIFAWDFGLDEATNPRALRTVQILVSGFGAMALFRSAFFLVRVGDHDVGVGPSGLLQIFLDAADRGVDRARANPRAIVVAEIMRGVSFDRAQLALPTLCFALMVNVPAEEQAAVGKEVAQLASADMDDRIKSLILGLTLMNIVGEHVLRAAVQSLSENP